MTQAPAAARQTATTASLVRSDSPATGRRLPAALEGLPCHTPPVCPVACRPSRRRRGPFPGPPRGGCGVCEVQAEAGRAGRRYRLLHRYQGPVVDVVIAAAEEWAAATGWQP